MFLLADGFATGTFLILLGGVLIFLAIGRWHSRGGVEIMDQDRQQRWGVQAHIEDHDIGEMLHAENTRRARRGEAPETVNQVVERVSREELGRLQTEEQRQQPNKTPK